MKILLITDNHNPKGGGAEKYLFKLKEQLSTTDTAFSLGFGPKNIKTKDSLVIKETKSLIIRHFWRLFFNPLKYFKIKKYIKEVKPDLIHIHNINKYTFSLLKAIKGYNVKQTVHDYSLICPTLWNVHNNLEPCPTGFRKKCFFKHRRDNNFLIYLTQIFFFYKRNKLLKKIVSEYISPSPKLKQYLEKNGFKNVTFKPNFIDNSININPNFSKINKFQILYLGQLEPNKGVSILINSLVEVIKIIPQIKLKIAGTGSQKKELQYLVKKLSLNKNISFLGWVENIGNLIQESSFIVVPSIILENAPVVLQEAMVYSRAAIGSNRGGIPWLIIPNKTGLLFNINKPHDLSSKIITLLSNKNNIIKYGQNNHNRIKEFK